MDKFYSLIIRNILFVFAIGSFTTKLIAQPSTCMDFGVGIGEDPYIFIDFFKTAGAWKVVKSNDNIGSIAKADRYKTASENEYKIVNGAYQYLNPIESNGDCNAIHYWDMMADQGKVLANGYPSSVPLTIHPYKPKSVDANQGIDFSKSITIGKVSRDISTIPEGILVYGWVLRWKGKGTFTMDGVSNVNMVAGSHTFRNDLPTGSTYAFTSAAGGGGKATVKYAYSPNAGERQLTIESSDSLDPLRDIQFIYPGMESILDAGQNINPKFIEMVNKYKVIRYSDYMHANNILERPYVPNTHPYHVSHYLKEISWSERTMPTWYKVNATHEYIIEISNLTHTSPWVNIPYGAGKEYVEKMVDLYISKLDPDLKIYLELGNELWNWGGGGFNLESCSWQPSYGGYFYFAAYGDLYYPGLGANASSGKRMNDLFKWLTAAAGSSRERITRIVGGQTGYNQLTTHILSQVESQNWDALAINWYYGLMRDTLSSNICKSPNGKNWRGELYNYWENNPNDQSGFNQKYKEAVLSEFRCSTTYIRENALIAKSKNKALLTYEGGNAVIGGAMNGPYGERLPGELSFAGAKYPQYFTDNDFIFRLIEADRSEGSGDILNEIIDSLKENGVTLVNHYGLSSRPTAFGIWGLFNQTDMFINLQDLYAEYPKYRIFNKRVETEQSCSSISINQAPKFYIPNAFSPNEDRVNDTLAVFYSSIKDFELLIFNPWGELIHKAHEEVNEDNTGNKGHKVWDGKYMGEDCPIDEYPYIIKYNSKLNNDSENPRTMKGTISIVR